ncbi:MAG: hypothetical protein ABW133_10860 [Polyangiaceae bacterium]
MGAHAFTRLGELARTVGTGNVSRAVDSLGERRAVEAFEKSRTRLTGLHKAAGLATIFATAAAAIVIFSLQLSRSAVSWKIDGAESGGTYVSPVYQDATVRFSEGTEFAVSRGSRLRVAEATAKTVKAVLEVGASRVRMGKGSPVSFQVEAGPFAVLPSTMATLMVEWLADELLRVSIFEGETSVQGTPSPLHLHAGQQVSANARDGTVEVRPLSAVPAVLGSASPEVRDLPAPVPSDMPSSLPAEEALAPSPSPGPSTAAARRPTWSDAVAAGDYAGVIREAERRGIAQVLSDASLGDLAALADAARLTSRVELGKRALLAERNRFAKTSAARDAAFFLGRIADDQEHAPASAIGWYETYLSEAPRGPFAAEAFGRKMVALSRQSGRAAARATAVEYLRRFPKGPHAAVARDLAEE